MIPYSMDDRHRSVRRFLMVVLGSPPWRLRTARAEVPDEERPVGIVEADTPVMAKGTSRITVPQGMVMRQQTLPITLYPEMRRSAEDGGDLMTPDELRVIAQGVAQRLYDALQFGVVDEHGVRYSHPERIPVFDYSAVSVLPNEDGSARPIPTVPYGWLHADDYPTRVLQDPNDLARWTVTCPLRMSWDQPGRGRPYAGGGQSPDVGDGPIVTDVPPQPQWSGSLP